MTGSRTIERPPAGSAASEPAPGVDTRRILLLLLPFWPPLIPPMGLATLKGHLHAEGFVNVRAVDLNCTDALRIHQTRYLECLRRRIPREKRGVLGKLGHEVLQNHLLAWKNSQGCEEALGPTLETVIAQTFYVRPERELVRELNVVVRDFFRDLRGHLRRLYDEEGPAVLGVSVPDLSTLAAAMLAFELFKERWPEGLTVLGGSIFLTGLADSPDFGSFLTRASAVDKVVVGDGVRDLVSILRGTGGDGGIHVAVPPGAVPGTASRTRRADYSDFDIARYPYIGTEQTISCPYSCGFCNLPRYLGPYKKRPAALMGEEMRDLHERYGSQLIFMADSLLNPVIDELTDELLRLAVPLYIDGYLRVQEALGRSDKALKLRRGGLYRARIGVESGSQRVLDLMGKQARVRQATDTVRALAAAGIKTTVFIVVGYPGETEDDFQATLDWITELQDDIWQVDCSPFTYWYSGQCHGDEWAPLRRPLYTPEARELLLIQSWTLECEPSREEAYRRMNRVVELCTRLGIPDPYDIKEHYQADQRWKRLHANAVPSLIEFALAKPIDECRTVERLVLATAKVQADEDFLF